MKVPRKLWLGLLAGVASMTLSPRNNGRGDDDCWLISCFARVMRLASYGT